MIRARLLTSLAFNATLACWVYHDARARGASKPVFAAVLALLWGPLGLGLWESDRPLLGGETRRGVASAIARGFLRGWIAMLPAVLVLAHAAIVERSAVPGSLGRQWGLLPASAIVTTMLWGAPALLALALGRLGRPGGEAHGSQPPRARLVPATAAAAFAGLAALATALLLR